MGRFSPGYLADHYVYNARQGNEIVGFSSFHTTTKEICLDLMRTRHSAPNGTMHLLVLTAITEAAQSGYRRFSLAALPRQIDTDPNPVRHLALRVLRSSNAQGLSRFKACFAPRLQPLYAMAPRGPALVLGPADLARAIRHDGKTTLHDLHEKNAFAPLPQT